MKRYAVTTEALDPAAIERMVRAGANGGVVTFEGVVREEADDGRQVRGLEYEAHVEMAEREFALIANEARARFGPCQIAMHHRVGALSTGELAVVVCVASKHRAAAFDACRYAIDELKERAPIWKRERYADGGSQWRANDGSGPARES